MAKARPNNPKLKLLGFNNLTKSLSLQHLRHLLCAHQAAPAGIRRVHRRGLQRRAPDRRSSPRWRNIIGANILNVARQDYDPQGASVTMLISEGHHDGLHTPQKDSVVAHLDKSHITVHTYPETHPDQGISTFRADIDVSTCGRISPLKALNYLINSLRVRHRGHGLPRARLHPQRARHEALHRPPDRFDPELHRARTSATAT